jgi:uncharacterized protein YbgA (DUF1722 family)/uncharacterized protein YbbK (DUF523 family)
VKAGLKARTPPARPIRVGISSCLLGQEVRFDGGHKRDRFLADTLGQYVEWVPVCPEVEMGLGTPREPIRLIRRGGEVHLVGTTTATDVTEGMRSYAAAKVTALQGEDLSGYVLKKGSPSCGMELVRLYGTRGAPARTGRGLFAGALLEKFPSLPVEEEGRLRDPRLRENWVERLFAYRRLRDLWSGRWTRRHLVAFHAAHKLVLLSHSTEAYRSLGRLVARNRAMERAALRSRYENGFMRALAILATHGRHANVLRHVAGYFKNDLDATARKELAGLIGDFRQGLVPLVVPLALVAHYVRHYDVAEFQGQIYLSPQPREMALRNLIWNQ